MQKGFIQFIVLGIVGLIMIGVGAWYTQRIQIPDFPPPGCYYQQVQCIQAPCNPILICGAPSPNPVVTSQATPFPVSSISSTPISVEETACDSDSECGVNICECKSARKESIKTRDKMCTRYCQGEPKCINNKCVLSTECKITGCSGEICSDKDLVSPCDIKAEYGCYGSAKCERQVSGKCDWTQTEELNKCLGKFQSK